ncbi:4'-phosphopantetheinyl transferase family protein [Lysobacter cavernae]|uniref:4'-phosphopantetheinyl transferase family protein n=1 Tax=Lysobacter cavernae TaxID=1685901 RepID=A0ABV7RPH7_9GAMM
MLRVSTNRASTNGEAERPGSNDLRKVLTRALPSPHWMADSSERCAVVLFELDDWRAWLPEATAVLDATERERVQRQRRTTGREALALAYALHRLLLGIALGCDARAVPLGRDSRGCPRLADGALHTSLSHADGVAAIAVTAAGPIGVDIEAMRRASVMPEIAERVCHPVEALALRGIAAQERAAALLQLWVRKEALLKAAGIGLACEMNSFTAPLGVQPLPSGGCVGMTALHRLVGSDVWEVAVAAPPTTTIISAWLRPDGAAPVASHGRPATALALY